METWDDAPHRPSSTPLCHHCRAERGPRLEKRGRGGFENTPHRIYGRQARKLVEPPHRWNGQTRLDRACHRYVTSLPFSLSTSHRCAATTTAVHPSLSCSEVALQPATVTCSPALPSPPALERSLKPSYLTQPVAGPDSRRPLHLVSQYQGTLSFLRPSAAQHPSFWLPSGIEIL